MPKWQFFLYNSDRPALLSLISYKLCGAALAAGANVIPRRGEEGASAGKVQRLPKAETSQATRTRSRSAQTTGDRRVEMVENRRQGRNGQCGRKGTDRERPGRVRGSSRVYGPGPHGSKPTARLKTNALAGHTRPYTFAARQPCQHSGVDGAGEGIKHQTQLPSTERIRDTSRFQAYQSQKSLNSVRLLYHLHC